MIVSERQPHRGSPRDRDDEKSRTVTHIQSRFGVVELRGLRSEFSY